MDEPITISIYQIVGDAICAEASDGEKVAKVIANILSHNKPIVLSFLNVEIITSAFLNSAIGVMYKNDETAEKMKTLVTVKDMTDADTALLRRVVETAKEYYKDPERMERSLQEVLGEE